MCRFSVAGMTKLSTGDATGDRKSANERNRGIRGERRVRYGELNLAPSLGIAIIWLEDEYNFGVTA